jgi:predicted ATPase
LEEKIFEIVNQFDRGVTLMDLPEEREQVAELNLLAGKRAKTSTAYASALNYLAAGRELLPEDSWERRYELIFSLEYHRAECELLTAALAEAGKRFKTVESFENTSRRKYFSNASPRALAIVADLGLCFS